MLFAARDLFQAVIARFNVSLARCTDDRLLHGLLADMWPIDSGHNLIRLGEKADGGYLVPNDLEGINAVMSPGVGGAWDFERDCLSRGMTVHMLDGAINETPIDDPNVHFLKRWLGSYDDSDRLTLASWLDHTGLGREADLLLQMDIEGAEWEVLASTGESALMRFRIIVVEFHQFHLLTQTGFYQLAEPVLRKVLRSHSVVHLHVNDCCGAIRHRGRELPRVVEVTFLRKDRLEGFSKSELITHSLDRSNTGSDTRLDIDRRWRNA